MNLKTQYDAIIIGAGPAGSAMASYLALNNVSCLIVEKSIFPREHVGESLVPSAMRILDDIGALEKIHLANFRAKNGVGWTSAANGVESGVHEFDFKSFGADIGVDVDFSERKQPGLASPYTYHVDRGKFDALLAKHAVSLGVDIAFGKKVTEISFFENAHGASIQIDGSEIRCNVVVDASGRNTFLGRKFGFIRKDPIFDQYSIHNWFAGLKHEESENRDFTYVHFVPGTDAWIWQIPISEDVTSVGVVSQASHFKNLDMTNEEYFWTTVEKRPSLYRRLRSAKAVRSFKVEADYSYAMDQLCGDNFVMIGDAARFVDPIFSNGVSIALRACSPQLVSYPAATKKL